MLAGTYVGGEPVGRRGLVDVVLVVVRVGAALRGLPLAPAHRAALHHAAAHLGRRLLRRPVRVALLRHHPEDGSDTKKPKNIQLATEITATPCKQELSGFGRGLKNNHNQNLY